MKNSSSLQIIVAVALLSLAAAGAVLLNKPTEKTDIKEKPQQIINTFAVTDVRVFDGEKTIEKTSVLVQDGKIAAIGNDVKIPKDIAVYRGEGKTLLPGLIDSHTHTYGDARKEALRFGVTTELDMFTDWRVLAEAKKQRESYAKTELADLWSAGTLATAPGGHGTEYGMQVPTLTKAEEANAFVQARAAEGSDYIKIVYDDGSAYGESVKIKSLTRDVTLALIRAAKTHNKKAIVHIASLDQAKLMAEQDADGLAHIFINEVADAPFIKQARTKKLFIVPTLSVTASLAGVNEGKNLAVDNTLKNYLSKAQTLALNAGFPAQWQNPKVLENALASVKLLHQAGVPLLAGTDAGNPSTAHGISMHGELTLLVKAGLSPIAALNAATALPAKTFGLHDRGRIAVSLRADLVLVDGNPTQDIHRTRHIDTIWKNGHVVSRTTASEKTIAAVKPSQSLISDFEQAKISSRYGAGWNISTDAVMNGASSANMTLIKQGANNSSAALEITGEVKTGFSFPWAGAYYAPGTKESPNVDYSNAKTLAFWAKGDGRTYNVMAFSSASGGIPPTQTFIAGPQWQEIRLPLNAFDGLELTSVTGFSFNAGAPEGSFRFMIDNVEIK
jgi:imidazolonepropionase-like amidohydrolase